MKMENIDLSAQILFDCIRRIDKPPKSIQKEAWARFKSANFWNVAKVAVDGDNAYIVMTGSGMKRLVFIVPDFRNRSECEIEQAVGKACDHDGAWPLGRNFSDCLGWLRNRGLKGGYVSMADNKRSGK